MADSIGHSRRVGGNFFFKIFRQIPEKKKEKTDRVFFGKQNFDINPGNVVVVVGLITMHLVDAEVASAAPTCSFLVILAEAASVFY